MKFQVPREEPYSKVVRRMWGDKGFKSLSNQPSGRLLWCYLLTGPDCTVIPGLLPKMGVGTLADHLGWTYAAVKKCWNEIAKAEMAEADWTTGVIWLPKAIAYNAPANPNVVTSWRSVVLPDCALVEKALRELRARMAIRESKGFLGAFDEVFAKRFPQICTGKPVNGSANGSTLPLVDASNGSAKGLANGTPNQDQEQDQESTPLTPLTGGIEPSTRKPTAEEREWAETVRKNTRSGCPHADADGNGRCDNAAACVGKLVMWRRTEEAHGMAAELTEAR